MKITERFPALASRDFLIFWIGQFVSLIGTWMQSTTLPYLAYRLSNDPFILGLVGFSSTLPALILTLPGGVIIERLDKRKTVIGLQAMMMLQAFIMAFLALNGLIQIWHILILAFLLGSVNAIEITARQAMLVELVGKQALPNAIALQSTIMNAARVLGPALIAPFLIILGGRGEGYAFLFNAFSYLFVIVGLFFTRPRYRANQIQNPQQERNLIVDFREGLEYIKQTKYVVVIIMIASLIGFFGFPFIQQIPVIAGDILRQAGDTPAEVAARNSLLYAFQGVGALVAAIFLALFSNLQRKGLLLTIGQFVYSIVLILISGIHSTASALALIALLGWSTVTQLAMMNTLIQLEVPDQLRGRVFSIFLWAILGIAPLGNLAVGWLVKQWDLRAAALVCGGICLVASIIIHSLYPGIRKKIA
ncbi:MAG: MFS transporter [Chloroflexota bacterium]